MRAVVITKHGDPSVLQVQERPDPPPPGAGQVRIAVRAAGVNFADHMARVGLYPDAPKLPSVVGYEVAGTIEAVGDDVDSSLRRPTRLGWNAFRRLRRNRQRQPIRRRWPARNAELRTGRRRPRQLRHRVGRTARLRIAACRRAGADPRGGGWSRHRGDPAGQAHRSRDPRHRVAGQASATHRNGRGPHDRLPPRWLVEGPAALRHRARRDRRRLAAPLLHIAAARRQAGGIRHFGVATGRKTFPAYCFATAAADAARFQPDQATLGVQGRHRTEHARPVGRPRHARAVDRATNGGNRTGVVNPIVHGAVPFDNAPEAHRILAARENVGKVVLVP